MKSIFMLLAIVVLLGGCATANKTYTSEGKEGYIVYCGGNLLNWGACYEKSAKICGSKGYDVLEKSGDQGFVVSGNQSGFYGSSVNNRSMIIKCKSFS